MPEQGITIEGLDETCRMLAEAPKDVIPAALLHGLAAGGQVIEEYIAGELVAGGEVHSVTGELLEDLGTTVTIDAGGRGGFAASGFSSAQGYKAGWVEYGHRMIGHKPDKKELGMVKPHPFMRLAAEAAAEAAVEAFQEAVMADLAKAGILDAA